MLAVTAAKKFKVERFTAMTIGAAMCYPVITALASDKNVITTLFAGTPFASEVYATFLGIPMISMNYTSTVIPVILAVWFASIVEKWCKKWIPTVVKTFLVPFVTLLIVIPLTFLIIGPVATWIGAALAAITSSIYNFSPILAGLVVGAFWQVFVIFGVHWGLVAVAIANLAAMGYDPIISLSLGALFAQTGVVLAILMQTKDEKLKGIAFPAFISGIFGVTEPAIYGVTLSRKKPFVLSCIGAGLGGMIIGFFGTKGYMMGGMGIFSIPTTINSKVGMNMSVYGLMIAMTVSFILGLVLQLVFGKSSVDNPEELALQKAKEEKVENNNPDEKVVSPINRQVMTLSEVKDEVFSSGAMGKGMAIEPTDGVLHAPADGQIIMTFPTSHAIGMRTTDGAEILIHIGMDTVNLQGKGFNTLVEKGQNVKVSDELVKFDIPAIKKAGYSVTTPIVVTNSQDYADIKRTADGQVKVGQEILDLQAEKQEILAGSAQLAYQ